MQVDPIRELRDRVASAREQTFALRDDVLEWGKDAIRFREDGSEPPWIMVKAKLVKQLPILFRTRSGQIVHELRSCLDGLASTLAIRNGKSTTNVFFPISSTAAAHATDAARKIAKLSASDQAKLLALDTHGGANPLLWGFHVLDRERKHVRLTMQTLANTGVGLRRGSVPIMIGQPAGDLELGKETIVATIIPGDERIELSLPWSLRFAEPPQLTGAAATQQIEWLANEVDRIINALA